MAELTIDQHECFSDSPFFRSQLLQLQTTTADFEECVKALTRSARLIIDVGACAIVVPQDACLLTPHLVYSLQSKK